MLQMIRRSPKAYGYQKSRWTLSMILKTTSWLNLKTVAGVSRLLKRLRIHYKRGREYVHSPDPYYQEKFGRIELMRFRALYAPTRYVFLYLDELTYYRQPTVANAYEQAGHLQPLAVRSHASNTHARILATVNIMTGQVIWLQRSKTDLRTLANFWYSLREHYAEAEVIYVALDNWPVHFHPDVLAPLQKQRFLDQPPLPAHWSPNPSPQALHDELPIQLLPLPTYASWLNPIEKLWRWLKQDILHLHRHSEHWPELKTIVETFLQQFAHGSSHLLRYIGLLPS
jgi:hypothetical protein